MREQKITMWLGSIVLLALMAASINAAGAGQKPTGATATNLTNTTWDGSATPSGVSTAGGNLTNATLYGQAQTWKWAGFYGDIYANLTLKDNAGYQFYYWNILNISGTVIAAQNSSLSFSSIDTTSLTGATLDSLFFPSDTSAGDNATMTFNDTSLALYIYDAAQMTVVAGAAVHPYGSSAWTTQAANISLGTATNTTVGFVANINKGGTLWNTGTGDYEMLVPARNPNTAVSVVYYFYLHIDGKT